MAAVLLRESNHNFSLRVAFSVLIFSFLCIQHAATAISLPVPKTTTHPVLTYRKGQVLTSSTLVWEAHNSKDSKQLQYAVEGGKYITEEENYTIYVCRVKIDGVSVVGHTEKINQMHECVAAHYKQEKYENFDLLVNRNHLGKIAWRSWHKFQAAVPTGAISISKDGYIGRHLVKRRQQYTPEGAATHWGANFTFGRLDPTLESGLGKILVMENDMEVQYEEGEVLVEIEPYRYELRNIELSNLGLEKRVNLTELASTILANRNDGYMRVEAEMLYEYENIANWGKQDGAALGLPTTIFEKNVNNPIKIEWGLKHTERHMETKNAVTKLWPGTAMNVTLRGKYVILEAPYTAILHAFYNDTQDSVSRKIKSEVRKSYLEDVKLEYSPVYWLENGTIIPTTTTSTTTTTTHATTKISSSDPTPIHEPPIGHMNDIGEAQSGADMLEKSLQDSPAAISNDITNEIADNFAEKHQKPALAGVPVPSQGAYNTAVGYSAQLWLTLSSGIILLLASMANR